MKFGISEKKNKKEEFSSLYDIMLYQWSTS